MPLEEETTKRPVWQASTLNALALGHFDATCTAFEALRHGDVGLGSFEGLGGEMVVLNGVAYNGAPDGTARLVAQYEPVSFCMMAPFDHYAPVFLSGPVDSVDGLVAVLEQRREVMKGRNALHSCIATGTVSHLRVRSVDRFSRPYPRLSDATEGQHVFERERIDGTIVGFRVPGYLSGVGLPGWHFHFIDEHRRFGGHVIAFGQASLACQITRHDAYELSLPEDRSFSELSLASDLVEETLRAEGMASPRTR
jgi:acetolactate decarboxylase